MLFKSQLITVWKVQDDRGFHTLSDYIISFIITYLYVENRFCKMNKKCTLEEGEDVDDVYSGGDGEYVDGDQDENEDADGSGGEF